MTKIVQFAEDERLAVQAAERGLFLSVDKFGRYYLSLPSDEIDRRIREDSDRGKMCINPYLVLFRATLQDVRDYLDVHTGPHRFLSPNEILPQMASGL